MRKHGYLPLIVSALFVLLALSFIHGIWDAGKTINENPLIDDALIRVTTVRTPKLAAIAGELGDTACVDCHASMEVPKVPPRASVSMHENAKMEHGTNDRCFTCHSAENRGTLVDLQKAPIPFAQSDRVCAQCHAAVHRDWEAGAHGRRNGSWKATDVSLTVAACVACHDPHSPKFKSLQPAPAPVRENYAARPWVSCGRCHPWIAKFLTPTK